MQHVVLRQDQLRAVAAELLVQAESCHPEDRVWLSQGARSPVSVQASLAREDDPRVLDLQDPVVFD